jgi:hypothetical protein
MCVMVAVDPPTPTMETPRNLVPIISRCLAKTPDGRYANVAELARDLAMHAREPDKAQMIVDRVARMLGRTTKARTPPVGVAQLVQAAGGSSGAYHLRPPARPTPAPTPPHPVYTDETPRTGYRSPFGDLPNGFTPATLATGTPPAMSPGMAATELSEPGMTAPGLTPPTLAPIPGFAPALPPPRSPEATPSAGVPVPTPRATPSQKYSVYPLPLPEPLPGQLRYLRPGMALPRRAEDLTTTQVISKPARLWLVLLVTMALAVATALTVIAIMGGAQARPEDLAPDFVRMRTTPGPIVSPINEPSAAPAPAPAPSTEH